MNSKPNMFTAGLFLWFLKHVEQLYMKNIIGENYLLVDYDHIM